MTEKHETGIDSNDLTATKLFRINQMYIFCQIVVVTNVHHYLNLQDISIILLENENVISQQTQLNSFLMSQPDATIVYDKEDLISENRLDDANAELAEAQKLEGVQQGPQKEIQDPFKENIGNNSF